MAAEWMKMKIPYIVLLPTQAVELVATLHRSRGLSDLVFPGERNHERPMSDNTILKALKRMDYSSHAAARVAKECFTERLPQAV
jgi:integrase